MNFAARFFQHPSNKAKFIRWVVNTANVALMVGLKLFAVKRAGVLLIRFNYDVYCLGLSYSIATLELVPQSDPGYDIVLFSGVNC